MTKFVALYDLHWGFERVGGHKRPLHDERALKSALKFISEFEPDVVILGGDMLDCACISHHTKGKPGQKEGLRLLADAKGLQEALIKPLENTNAELVYITGNHEAWLDQLVEGEPGLEGIVDLRAILALGEDWRVVPQGGTYKLGKLVFAHGDQFSGGEHIGKAAVTAAEKSVRFGHFHTYQVYTKTSVVTEKSHTGIAIPCLCRKDPSYGKGAPNKWIQGFNYGFVGEKGTFHDYVALIQDGSTVIDGKVYRG